MKVSEAYVSLLSGQNLREKESQQIFHELFTGKIDALKAKTLLLLLAKKGETAEEVTGCLKALQKLEPAYRFQASHLMDTCGTGGDGSHSLNVSTLAALIIAGAGGKVAKHGNRGLSSKCGSSDLLESFGVQLEAPANAMIQSIRKNGIGYFHAPFHHPIFSKMQTLRRSLKTRTLFNLLGPLSNPVRPKFQLVGVSRAKDFKLYQQVLKNLGVQALVCHSTDGLDEISISAPTRIAHIHKGKIRQSLLTPQTLGFKKASKKSFTNKTPEQNKKMAKDLLTGKLKGPARDLVILNAGAGLWICGKTKNLKEGIQKAAHSLDSGKAYQALLGLKKASL